MIVNCFLLFNEIEHLRLRLEYEYPFYDKFLIVEGTKTFAGQPKILYFEKYKHLFDKYLDKIHYEVVDDLPEVIKLNYTATNNLAASEYRWHLERHSRECMKRGLAKLGLEDDDLVVVSDVDELLDVHKLERIAKSVSDSEIHRFELIDYRYSVALEPLTNQWIGPYLVKYSVLRRADVHTLRAISVPASNLQIIRFYVKAYLEAIVQSFKRFTSLFQSHPDKPKNLFVFKALDTLEKFGISNLSSGTSLKEAEIARLIFNQNLPTDVKVRKSGIKKAIFHADTGWHFSHMTGGFKDYFVLKIQNFSHSELPSAEKLNTELDYQEVLENYVRQKKQENLYDFETLHEKVPNFIREHIADFCFLLLPSDMNSEQIKNMS